MDHATAIAAADATLTSKLESLLPILDAFNYRHRNQHSSSHWWSKFQILRRGVHSLAADLARHQALHQLLAEKKSTAAKSKYKIVQKQVLARATLLRGQIVPKTYLCFSQLISDNQHATLGLMLLGVLARVNSVLSAILPQQKETIGERSDGLLDQSLVRPADSLPAQPTDSDADRDADRGIVISRNYLPGPKTKTKTKNQIPSDGPKEDKYTQQEKRPLHSVGKSIRREKKKNKSTKKSKGDELSSLFRSL